MGLIYFGFKFIRYALDTGRYVEIRGTSGVGKSGLLKHLARQVSAESPIIVLNPVRTTPRGWSHLRAVLDFDGTAPELLADLAASGGATDTDTNDSGVADTGSNDSGDGASAPSAPTD